MSSDDLVNHPPHYQHPSGVECIEIVEHLGFCMGNAIKYLFRAGKKDVSEQDLRKSLWYLNREIAHRQAHARSASRAGRAPAERFETFMAAEPLGNVRYAIQHIWQADRVIGSGVHDLKEAREYVEAEILSLRSGVEPCCPTCGVLHEGPCNR